MAACIGTIGRLFIIGCLLHDDAVKYSGAYNFGPNPADHLTVKELVEMAIETWQSGDWKDTGDKNQVHEANLLKLDISKAKNKLNWEPKLNAATAIAWTIEWYTKTDDIAGFTFKQINDYMHL